RDGVDHAVVGRDGAVGDEVPAAVLQGGDEAGVIAHVLSGDLAEPVHAGVPVGPLRVEVVVRAEGGHHARVETAVGAQLVVLGQIGARIVGGGQHLDAEGVHQRPGTEVRFGDAGG